MESNRNYIRSNSERNIQMVLLQILTSAFLSEEQLRSRTVSHTVAQHTFPMAHAMRVGPKLEPAVCLSVGFRATTFERDRTRTTASFGFVQVSRLARQVADTSCVRHMFGYARGGDLDRARR